MKINTNLEKPEAEEDAQAPVKEEVTVSVETEEDVQETEEN